MLTKTWRQLISGTKIRTNDSMCDSRQIAHIDQNFFHISVRIKAQLWFEFTAGQVGSWKTKLSVLRTFFSCFWKKQDVKNRGASVVLILMILKKKRSRSQLCSTTQARVPRLCLFSLSCIQRSRYSLRNASSLMMSRSNNWEDFELDEKKKSLSSHSATRGCRCRNESRIFLVFFFKSWW